MNSRLAGLAGATLLFAALTVLVTWPQALVPASHIANHHDAQFSIWRIGWIAHALASAPSTLFDANIFYPARTTLAYSDATMLEGLIGAPLLWARVSPTLVYNLLLLVGFIGSGVGMFVLARHLTGQTAPALVAGAVFVLLPYRIEHFMHLELQWAMFVPLTWWALHRLHEAPDARRGAMAGLMLALQVLACVYYGVFLVMTLVVFVPLLLVPVRRTSWRPLLTSFAAAALVAAVIVAPFAWPYLTAARELGGRGSEEIARYSATLMSYLSSPEPNRAWGWTADRWGGPELRLFPGLLALALGALGLSARPRKAMVLYLVTLAVAVELSFGLRGSLYQVLFAHVDALQGFRATARFAVIAAAALAVLAAFGTARLLAMAPSRAGAGVLTAALLLAMAGEAWNRPMRLTPGEPVAPPPVYQVLRDAAPGTVLELPVPAADRLPGNDPQYQIWSMWHWRPLVNGYSGYYPRDYLLTLLRMNVFPEEGTIDRLRAHDVRYIVVHRAFYDQESYTRLMLRMATRPELKPWGAYRDTLGTADIFELIAVD
ncbi:MAG: hypothetical protein U0Q55_11710 [Vicinamibacterales bacterium]